jgi:hypothetical protein
MYYVCVPPSYASNFLPFHRPALALYFHEGSPLPVPMGRGEGGGEGPEGRWQPRDHQMQREQQALGAMDTAWMGQPMEVRGAEMQYHYQYAQCQQQHHGYHQQQEQQQLRQSEDCVE